ALDEPLGHPAPQNLGNERRQPVQSVHWPAGDYRSVNDLETTQVRGKRSVDAVLDKAPQAFRHRPHVGVLAQFDGNLRGANFTEIQASNNLILRKVEDDPAPRTVAHMSAATRYWNHQGPLAGNLQIVEALADLRRSRIASLARSRIPAQLRLIQQQGRCI